MNYRCNFIYSSAFLFFHQMPFTQAFPPTDSFPYFYLSAFPHITTLITCFPTSTESTSSSYNRSSPFINPLPLFYWFPIPQRLFFARHLLPLPTLAFLSTLHSFPFSVVFPLSPAALNQSLSWRVLWFSWPLSFLFPISIFCSPATTSSVLPCFSLHQLILG